MGLTRPTASAIWSGEKTSPNGRSIVVTCAPARPATSAMRPPKTPLTQTSILSPGSIRLTTQVSIPALPVPLTASVERVLRLKHLPQHRLRLVHDLQEIRVEVPDGRGAQCRQHARMRIARAGAHENAAGRVQAGSLCSGMVRYVRVRSQEDRV